MPAKILRIQFEKNIDENNILAGKPLHQRGSSEPPAVVQFIVRRKKSFLGRYLLLWTWTGKIILLGQK